MKMAGEYSQGNGFQEEEEGFRPRGNNLKLWGNSVTMNINPMIHTNIIQSPYFKTNLIELKTYHEIIDEIYYKVTHLEPWERNSRRIGGQTGMCGGVRGVGAGGIVSTAYCLLFKLFTLKLTRKQLKGLLEHPDSPYIRALGFMYIRYCLPPEDLWMWFSPYLDDEEVRKFVSQFVFVHIAALASESAPGAQLNPHFAKSMCVPGEVVL
ncbi:unnamed protein product [Hymenolepis diminuta]|uniref:Pre-mRNA-splicing factor 38 n=2 Tax=Hymenolepis diminuta TaxID=6216 RepID=A0A564Z3P7_HYMDI|nr:unnamed protein product [Hymenolepis diminuta]